MNKAFKDPLAPVVGQAYFDVLLKQSDALGTVASLAQKYKAELIGAGIGLGLAAAGHAAATRKGGDGLSAGQRAAASAERLASETEAAHPDSASAAVAAAAARSARNFADAFAKHPFKTGLGIEVPAGALAGAMIGKQLKAPLAALLK